MKKLYYLIVLTLILGLVLTGCSLLSNVGQVPATEQKGMPFPTAANLVALWHFDENSGTTAYDSTVNSNNGTVNGANWVDGKLGKALSFDDVSDYVNCGDDVSFDFVDKFTVEAWINLNVIPGYYDIIVNRAYGNWMVAVYDGKLMFGEYHWQGLWSRHIYSDVVPWTTGQWYHVAVVYDTIGKTADFFLDGVPIGTGRQSTDKYGIINSGIVGISSYIGATGFNGTIDEVRIWDGALTAEEIFYSYNDETLHVDDDWVQLPGAYKTINEALDVAGDGDTIIVHEGTYYEVGQIVIDKDLTIIGADKVTTIIKPNHDTAAENYFPKSGWFYVDRTASFELSNVTLDGTDLDNKPRIINTALQSRGELVVEDCIIKNICADQAKCLGIGIQFLAGLNNSVVRCEFSDIERIGIHVRGSKEPTNPIAYIEDCTYVGKGDGDWLDYGIEFGGGGSGTVDGCDISACTGLKSETWTSSGIYATDVYGPGTSTTIKNSTLASNTHGIYVGYGDSDFSIATLTYNDIHNNDVGVYIRSDDTTVIGNYNNIYDNVDYGVEVNSVCTTTYDFENNWWGHPGGPRRPAGNSGQISGPKVADQVSRNVLYHPWLNGANSVSNIALDQTATASAALLSNPATLAVDGNYDTLWNAGAYQPQWIEIDLGKGSTVVGLRLLTAQSPVEDTTHVVLFSDDGGVIAESTFSGYTENKQWLETWFDVPLHGVKTLRVTTTESLSWVAWFEIEVYGWQ